MKCWAETSKRNNQQGIKRIGDNMKHMIFGESHGPAIGVTLMDVPSGIAFDEELIKRELARRATGKNALSTARKEKDQVEVLSGVFDGKTTGTPLTMVIRNGDQHSKDYSAIRDLARPGHGDYTGFLRYEGCNDYRGGGHFSGRLTAPLVAAGAVAKMILREKGVQVGAHIASIGGIRDTALDMAEPDMAALLSAGEKDFPVLCDEAGQRMQALILGCREEQDSIGGEITCCLTGIPGGLGAPDFDRNAETVISRQIFAIPAIKAIAFGEGFGFAGMRGSQANDPFCLENGQVRTKTNHNGGILGGITSGMPVVFTVAVKPTPSISRQQDTVDFRRMQETTIAVTGRHDPCIVHRAVPVVEAAAALAAVELMKI